MGMAEWCIECLLSLVEIVQLQQFVFANYFKMDRFHDSLFKKIHFPDNVPKSFIVYGEMNGGKVVKKKSMSSSKLKNFADLSRTSLLCIVTEEKAYCQEEDEKEVELDNAKRKIREKVMAIYDKYIKVGSEYEVNIAWSTREKLIAQLDETKMNDDDVCNEMYKLMRDSYDRFRRKN